MRMQVFVKDGIVYLVTPTLTKPKLKLKVELTGTVSLQKTPR